MNGCKAIVATLIIPFLFGCSKKSNKVYERNGNIIKFGYYPSSIVSDSTIINNLNSKIGDLPNEDNNNSWISYNYYILDEVSNYMWYIDIDLDNDNIFDFRGVYFTKYRPYNTNLDSTENNTCQFYCGFEKNHLYWFKYEKIEWTIIKEEKNKATIITKEAIDSQEYYPSIKRGEIDHDGIMAYANNYELSYIRKWLNESFLNTAFNEKEASIINVTHVDNSYGADNGDTYEAKDTLDKVYLLSRDEALKYFDSLEKRQISSTTYARCMGLNSPVDDCAPWLLRSPYVSISNYVLYATYDGNFTHAETNSTYIGIRPVIEIKL